MHPPSLSTEQSLLLFANPISGSGRGRQLAERLLAQLTRAGYRVALHTQPAATVDASLLRSQPAAAAIVVGGDGTLLGVAQRLLEVFGPQDLPPLLPVPLGTANLMARHLGCLWEPDRLEQQVLATLQGGTLRSVDVAQANGHPFLLVAGIGFDASVVHRLAARRRGPITYADYLGPTLASLANYTFTPLTIDADGQRLLSDTPAIAFAGNIPEYGAGFSVTPRAIPDDGLLDLCVLPCSNWQELLEMGCLCGSGLQVSGERAIYRRVKHFTVTSSKPVPVEVELDGEPAGFTPLEAGITGRQVRFVVPSKTNP